MTPLTPLSTSAAPAQQADLKTAATGFEAIFLRQMLAAARATDFGDDLFGSGQGEDTFAEMRDAQFADIAAAQGSLGLASMIEAQLARHSQEP